ncbi:PREDICTED: complement factor B-like [Priapulus caudatus]|uniref:Complement factor B-like n=1 Tax=Priapulus caudatus TaxID=37621 RepID=A0ABM1F258_PRICU|nr:PREDICTED: complement factor B-like [Priapulus caudatus]
MLHGATVLLLCLCLAPTGAGLYPSRRFLLDWNSLGRLHQNRQADDAVSNTATALKNNFLSSFSRRAPAAGGIATFAAARGIATFAAAGGATSSPSPVDVVLLLDSSGSVGSASFTTAKTVLKDICEFFDKENGISSPGIRVGGVVFSETGKTATKFNYLQDHTQNTLANVQAQILKIPFDNGGATATRIGLQLSYDMIKAYGRAGAKKSVFVLTDGQSNEGGNPCPKAADMKKDGIMIYVWSVGSNLGTSAKAELNCIATDPSHIFEINSFSSAAEVIRNLRNRFYTT